MPIKPSNLFFDPVVTVTSVEPAAPGRQRVRLSVTGMVCDV